MDFHSELSGTRSSLNGQGNVSVTNANAYGVDVQSIHSQLRFTADQAAFQGINIVQADQKITGLASYRLSTHAFQFDLTGTNLNLAISRSHLPTTSQCKVALIFMQQVPALCKNEPSTRISRYEILSSSAVFSDSTFDAKTQAGSLHLTGHSQYEQAQMTTDGTVHLRNDWPCNIKLHFSQVNADPLSIYMKGRINSHSLIDGDLLVQGPLLRPRELRVNGDFSNVTLGIGDVNIKN